jgi:hypothetical protein
LKGRIEVITIFPEAVVDPDTGETARTITEKLGTKRLDAKIEREAEKRARIKGEKKVDYGFVLESIASKPERHLPEPKVPTTLWDQAEEAGEPHPSGPGESTP